ncbi:MAG: molybdate ABC transporter substrate-binding protein [Dehalococcoidia bacterium]
MKPSGSPLRGLLPCVLVLVVALACACGDDDSTPGSITVFAAASLTDAFGAIGEEFEAANPGASVEFNFASSSALAVQIGEGAPADVFAAADTTQMEVVVESGDASEAFLFAANLPVVAVPAGSTAVATFEDLAKPGIRLVLAAQDVPIGRYAREVLENASGEAGIGPGFAVDALANLRSDEANVRAVLTKVQLGEADAGIVYATDLAASGDDVRAVEIPARFNVVASYPIAVITTSSNPVLALAFVDFVLSAQGQSVLVEFGFLVD